MCSCKQSIHFSGIPFITLCPPSPLIRPCFGDFYPTTAVFFSFHTPRRRSATRRQPWDTRVSRAKTASQPPSRERRRPPPRRREPHPLLSAARDTIHTNGSFVKFAWAFHTGHFSCPPESIQNTGKLPAILRSISVSQPTKSDSPLSSELDIAPVVGGYISRWAVPEVSFLTSLGLYQDGELLATKQGSKRSSLYFPALTSDAPDTAGASALPALRDSPLVAERFPSPTRTEATSHARRRGERSSFLRRFPAA